ncbi:MAG TPA: hypothetical protein VMV18_14735 [bacterium]|nr:hypothetical protein [bacterium]
MTVHPATRYCPWCAAGVGAIPDDGRCAGCGGRITDAALLAAPPATRTLRPDDADARAPANAPAGGSPLPSGAPNPTWEGLLRWAAAFLLGVVVFGVLAKFLAAPALEHVATPTPSPSASPAATAPEPAASPA